MLYYIVLYYVTLYYGINYNLFWCPRESSLLPPPSRPRMRKLLRRSAFTLWILLITLKQTHLKTASPQCTSTGNMLYLQCGAPSVISWFITPMNTIVIGIMNHSYCIEIINNLAIDWGPHPVPFWCNKKRPETFVHFVLQAVVGHFRARAKNPDSTTYPAWWSLKCTIWLFSYGKAPL